MTSDPRSREAAFADLVAGLIDARVDLASARFDAELEAAEASGRLDPATARLLRWWQRESVRAVAEHARTTVPASLVALEQAETEAREAVNRADAAWTTARGVGARALYPDPTPAPDRSAGRHESGDAAPAPADAPVADDVATGPLPPRYVPPAQVPPAAPAPPPPPPGPFSAAPAPQPVPPSGPPQQVAAPLPDYLTSASPVRLPPDVPYEPTPGDAGAGNGTAVGDSLAPPSVGTSPAATPADGRRRTLLAGLTVLPPAD